MVVPFYQIGGIKHVCSVILCSAGLIGAFSIASFFLVPTERLNSLIAKQLSEAFGHEVTVYGSPSVSFLPYLSVSFGPLAVNILGDENYDLIEVERAHGRLSVTSLWEGDPSLRFIVLEQAKIAVVGNHSDDKNWSLLPLFLTRDQHTEPPVLRFPTRLRSIRFSNSTVTLLDQHRSVVEEITAVNAEIKGPPRAAEFSVAGSAIWRGETMRFSVNIAEPGAVLGGGQSKTRLEFASSAFSGRFTGTVSGSVSGARKILANGTLDLTTRSAHRLFDWLEVKDGGLIPSGPLQLSGTGSFSETAFDFQSVMLRIGHGRAEGRLRVTLASGVIGLSGTLGSDDLSLENIGRIEDKHATLLDRLLDLSLTPTVLDLRLSAERSSFAGQKITELAVGLNLVDNNLVINVGNAQLLGEDNLVTGSLRGDVSISSANPMRTLKTSLTLTDTNFKSLSRPFAIALPLQGGLSLSLQMKTRGRDEQEMRDALHAELSARLDSGILHQISLDQLSDLTALTEGAISGLNQKTSYESGEISATIRADGLMMIDRFSLNTAQYKFENHGRVNLISKRIALFGTLSTNLPARHPEADVSTPIPLSFGGTLEKLHVSSVNGKAL